MSDTVAVSTLPDCDLCKALKAASTPAAVDGKTKQGPWAYMCANHWQSHGIGRLGTGFGQRLVLKV